jgi:hypothetical protein
VSTEANGRAETSVTGTEEIAIEDILEEVVVIPKREVPSIAPVALSVTPPPVSVARGPLSAPPPRRSTMSWIFGTVAISVLATLAVLVGLRLYEARVPKAVSSVTVVQAVGAPQRDEARIPIVRLDNLPVSSTKGTLLFPPSAKNHRVFVDGVVVGEANGPIEVKCGPRSVRLGSRGALQTIEVPCAGEVLVPLR